MIGALREWLRARRRSNGGDAPWSDAGISDEWFASHFRYAADVVHDALASRLDPAAASLLDFGCYDGITALGLLLRHGWRRVIGVDIDPGFDCLPRLAREQIGLARLPVNLSFQRIEPSQPLAPLGPVDAIISWSVFEHLARAILDDVVADFRATLRPGGYCFVQIEPLFYSPHGSHLGRFATAPWAHLRMTEDELEATIMRALPETVPASEITEQFRSMPFEEYKRFIFRHYLELNRITADEVLDLFRRHGFELLWERRHRTELPIPTDLSLRFDHDLLATREIVALFQAP